MFAPLLLNKEDMGWEKKNQNNQWGPSSPLDPEKRLAVAVQDGWRSEGESGTESGREMNSKAFCNLLQQEWEKKNVFL